MSGIATVLLFCAMLVAMCLLFIFIAVPLFKGLGQLVAFLVKGVGWFFMHAFEFIFGMIGDTVRFIGGIPVFLIFSALAVLNVVIGRWSAAGHFADSARRECRIGAACVYRVVLRRPLKLFMLHGVLEGFEERIPEAMAGAPGADKPSRRTGQFDGYEIVGSLAVGGSGAKLYVAKPDDRKRAQFKSVPDLVVIKSFALTEGSSLPQIVRESRALECARKLGHVIEHQMDEHRFFYVMPYHDGDHLGVITRQLHGEAGGDGLQHPQLRLVMSYVDDLLDTLSAYHKGGLWHKDVKPDNVIVHDGRAHLVDLGLVTPLRSAMTLTTHGTEYFRDPEMVRQALRGVKVHQVDGAKFDIYAVGAVLYFMMENTFPAHGGLSRFAKKSPESLRWIVRRAMAEYNQRYESADQMLGDLQAVLESRDPFAVRPVDLPSMRSGEGRDAYEADPERVAAAGSPIPPRPEPVAPDAEPLAHGWGVAIGAGGVKAGSFSIPPAGAPAAAAAASAGEPGAAAKRPALRVTNWWTGAYSVDDPATSQYNGPASPQQQQAQVHRAARAQARALRDEVSAQRRQGVQSMHGARMAAREQIKSARTRARDIRKRAHARSVSSRPAMHKVPNQPSRFLGFLVVAAVAFCAVAGIAIYKSQGPETYTYVSVDESGQASTLLMIGPDGGKPALIVTDSANVGDPRVQQQLMKIARKHEADGYDVVIQPDADHSDINDWLRAWRVDRRNKEADTALEEYMEAHNLYAMVHVTGDGERRSLRDTLIHSTRKGAADRRGAVAVPEAPAGPYLLINDHPAKVDPLVEERVREIVRQYRDRGWEIAIEDEAEAEIRKLLPAAGLDEDTAPSPILHRVLHDHGLAGVLRIDARAGEGEPHQRIVITRVPGEDVPHAPPAPSDDQG